MKTWYKLRPVDTFFFKGATPMIMGENHTSETIFPPHSSTIAGAVRTAVLNQQGIDPLEYGKDNFDDNKVISFIGKAGESPPFEILGPVFLKAGQIYIPAPFHWYVEKEDIKQNTAIPVYKSNLVESSFVRTSKGTKLYTAIGRAGELKTAGGQWISLKDFYSEKKEICFKSAENFFVSEPRTGIALDRKRKVRQSHLYTFSHIRFKPDVELVFGIAGNIHPLLWSKGILQLGGEKRLGYYEKTDIDIPENSHNTDIFMSLSALSCSLADPALLVAGGRIQYRGGWDMKKAFHKPLTGFYPAGSVFSEYFNENLIPVKGE